jgi:hypothetical protein
MGAFSGIVTGALNRRKELVDSAAEDAAQMERDRRLSELQFQNWNKQREVTKTDKQEELTATTTRRQTAYEATGMAPEKAKKMAGVSAQEANAAVTMRREQTAYEQKTKAVSALIESPAYVGLDDGKKEAFRAAYMQDPAKALNYHVMNGDDGKPTIVSEALYIQQMKLTIAKIGTAPTQAENMKYKMQANEAFHSAGKEKVYNSLKAAGVKRLGRRLDVKGNLVLTLGKGEEGQMAARWEQKIRTMAGSNLDLNNPHTLDELYEQAIAEMPFERFKQLSPAVQMGGKGVTPEQMAPAMVAQMSNMRSMAKNPANIDMKQFLIAMEAVAAGGTKQQQQEAATLYRRIKGEN